MQSGRTILDWGCGVGRVAAFWVKYGLPFDLHGCDIDAESVAWCQEHLKPAQFTLIAPDPPMPYADGQFDLVTGNSVFTHLTEMAQDAWLAELRRVVRAGGLVLVSVHGPFAARAINDHAALVTMESHGIDDHKPDAALDGITPPGYYRTTFHHPTYIHRRWAAFFDVLDIVQAGMNNFQDLVILRRPHD